jgi:hypothetical protein
MADKFSPLINYSMLSSLNKKRSQLVTSMIGEVKETRKPLRITRVLKVAKEDEIRENVEQ